MTRVKPRRALVSDGASQVPYFEVCIGFILLLVGGDALVRGAVIVACRLGVSPLLIGITIVGFGTSMPELVTSVQAALVGSPGIAVGNVVGSNIVNLLFILGMAALICPIATNAGTVLRDGGMALFAALACAAAVAMGRLNMPTGVVLLAMLGAYLAYAVRRERICSDDPRPAEAIVIVASQSVGNALAWAFLACGLLSTVFGARLLVSGAVELAQTYGVSETFLGLTVVAIATSLPEMATSIIATLRRQADVAFGNIIGSNIFNVFGILGVTAVVHPIAVPREVIDFDVWVMVGATLLLLVFALTGNRLSRLEGLVLLGGYSLYLAELMV